MSFSVLNPYLPFLRVCAYVVEESNESRTILWFKVAPQGKVASVSLVVATTSPKASKWNDFAYHRAFLQASTPQHTMLPRLLRSQARRAFATRNVITSRPVVMRGPVQRNVQIQKRTMIAAPKPGDGPLMSRRADRELPGTSSP